MAWVCDFCGARPGAWSGMQGTREFCDTPGCPGNSSGGAGKEVKVFGVSNTPPPKKPRQITISLQVSEEFARDASDEDLQLYLGHDAVEAVRRLLGNE